MSTNVLAVFLILPSLISHVLLSKGDGECGGDIDLSTGLIGEFFSPNFPYDTSPKVSCIWKFSSQGQNENFWIYIKFDSFELSSGDVLNVTDGNSKDVIEITGEKGFFVVAVSLNAVINFQTSVLEKSTENRRFHASFDASSCVIRISQPRSIFHAPLYLSQGTTENINCSWIITTNDNSLSLSFSEFKLNSNKLQVFSGFGLSSQPVATYSGNILPNDVLVDNYQMTVVITIHPTDKNITFIAETTIISSKCSTVIDMTSPTVINGSTEPTKPVNCVWIIQSPPSTTLLAKYIEVNLKNLQDFIIINDGGSRYSPNLKIIHFNDRNNSGSFTTTKANLLYIFFSSTSVSGLSSFKMNISAQTLGGNFYDQGTFSLSPNSTKSGSDVIFTLFADKIYQVEVSVIMENMLPESLILFYDVDDNSEELLANFTKDTKIYPVFSTTNKMSVVARGFKGLATMSGYFHSIPRGCDAFDRSRVGSYQLQQTKLGNCTWLIKPNDIQTNDVIALTLSTLQLSGKDAIFVYKGFSNILDNLIQVFNSSVHVQPVLYIDGFNGIRIDSHVDDNFREMVVIAFYEMQQGCNQNISLNPGDNLRITNVGYPSHYPLNVNCSWQINNLSNRSIFITFSDIDMYPTHNLSLYTIQNGDQKLLLTTSGKSYPDDVIVNDVDSVIVTWNFSIAYGSRSCRGFLIQMSELDCGSNLTSSKGSLTTPNFPSPVNTSIICIWGITVPKPTSPDVNIIELDLLENSFTTNPSKLEIHDGGSLSSPLLFHPTINQTALSRTNKLLIKYTNYGTSGTAYKLSFSTKSCDTSHQCRNKICMHPKWRCNGINNCGDFSDEENCDSLNRKPGVSMTVFGTTVSLTLILGIILTIGTPWTIRKIKEIRERRRGYQDEPILTEPDEDVFD